MIEFDGVTKRFPDGTTAVDNLTLKVAAGQIMVLVGPSGCGKTTTLRMINRLVEPSEGTILLNGEDIRHANPARLRRGIGYVIQQAGLFPHRTVDDNIATVPLLIGWGRAKARARARELMDLVGLDASLGRRYPHQLSGGQQQRVGVARALAADPPVLLMDEPFSAVDPVVRAGLQSELLRLQSELRKTVVFVTHDVEEAIKIGDRVTVMRPGGRVAQSDRPERLLAAPSGPYVEDFIGFDRGIRRLSFFPASGLDLDGDAVVSEEMTAGDGLHRARGGGQPWLLVTDPQRLPRGWVATSVLDDLPPGERLGDITLEDYGHVFSVESDSLRAALDATVLSVTGRAVGVDSAGQVVGVTSYDRLRAAIQSIGAGPSGGAVAATGEPGSAA